MAIDDDTLYGLTGAQLKELPDKIKIITGNDGNAYKSIKKSEPYTYETDYTNLDYDYANDYFENQEPEIEVGACTSFGTMSGQARFLARNYDWKYDNSATFIVRTPTREGYFATLGVAGAVPGLTQEFVDSKQQSDLYKVLPFFLQDGINEAGLSISTNVVAAEHGDNSHITPENPDPMFETTKICTLMFPRWVLDHCSDVWAVREALEMTLEMYHPQALIDMGYDQQFLIMDSHRQWVIVEFEDGHPVFVESGDVQFPAMTNFFIKGVKFNGRGVKSTVNTPATVPDGNLPSDNNLTDLSQGLERWNYLVTNMQTTIAARDVETVKAALADLNYTKSYSTSPDVANPFWYSEFVGGSLTVDNTPTDFAERVAEYGQKFTDRTRNGETWQTVHSSIYNLATKELHVAQQESGEYSVYALNSNIGDGSYAIPQEVLWASPTTSADEIVRLFGGEENALAFKKAVDENKPIAAWYEYKNNMWKKRQSLLYATKAGKSAEMMDEGYTFYYAIFMSAEINQWSEGAVNDTRAYGVSVLWDEENQQFVELYSKFTSIPSGADLVHKVDVIDGVATYGYDYASDPILKLNHKDGTLYRKVRKDSDGSLYVKIKDGGTQLNATVAGQPLHDGYQYYDFSKENYLSLGDVFGNAVTYRWGLHFSIVFQGEITVGTYQTIWSFKSADGGDDAAALVIDSNRMISLRNNAGGIVSFPYALTPFNLYDVHIEYSYGSWSVAIMNSAKDVVYTDGLYDDNWSYTFNNSVIGKDVIANRYGTLDSRLNLDEFYIVDMTSNPEAWAGVSITGGGGSSVEIVQTTGQATDKVMSQKAVTDELSSLGTRVGTTEQGISSLGTRVGTTEQGISGLDTRVGTTEQGISGLDTRVGTIEQAIGGVEQRLANF